MREKEIVIRLKLPTTPRGRWLLGIAAAVLTAGAVAYATVPNTFNPGDPLSSSKMNTNFSNLDGRVAALEQTVVPAGTIVAFGGDVSTVPGGWLLCDGSSASRVIYAGLFLAISVDWGVGDGVTTFNLPDLRGRFLRGVDGAAGNDPDAAARTASNTGGNIGNAVGSLQADQFASHQHGILGENATPGPGMYPTTTLNTGAGEALTTSSAGGNETRPKNAAVYYIIKY